MLREQYDITIVTVVFNNADGIRDCIDSVAAQVGVSVEHIIIDGGSTDGTLRVIEACSTAPAVVVSERDHGIYNALNKGFVLATGDIIGLLHSDDIFAGPDVLKIIVASFQDKSVDGVYGDLVYTCRERSKTIRYWRAGEYSESKLRFGWMIPHPTFFVRESVFKAYGAFDESYQISGDYEQMLRYLRVGRIKLHYVPQVLVKMRVGGASNANMRQLVLKTLEDFRIARDHGLSVLTVLCKNLRKIHQFFYHP